MDIDLGFIQAVLGLYNQLIKNGVSLVYIGKFNHQITKIFSAMYEMEMNELAENKATKRKVFHSMVEILQNMTKHSEQQRENYKLGKGLFMIGKKEENYYIITTNKIAKVDIPKLICALDQVNNATREELKDLYKKQLLDGKLSTRQGAGLGFIDIARKTGEKLLYAFLPIDQDNDYFILQIAINTAHFEEESE